MRKEATFLVAAAVLHAGIPLLARLVIHADTHAPTESVAVHALEAVEIPVEPLLEPAPRVEAPPSPNEPAPVAARTTPVAPRGAHEPSEVAAPTNPEPAATAAPTAPPSRAPDQYDALPDSTGDGIARAPGIGGPAVWALPGTIPVAPSAAAAPTVAPAPRPVDKDIAGIVIRDAMLEHDKRLGLDLPGAGNVANAVGSAVRGAETPNEGRATFEVRVGADGRVLGVRVTNFTAGSSEVWDRVAKAAAAALVAGRSIELNSTYAKGATVYVDVSSLMTLPSGAKSGVSLKDGMAKFDVADLGAHKSRVVRTSFRVVAAR